METMVDAKEPWLPPFAACLEHDTAGLAERTRAVRCGEEEAPRPTPPHGTEPRSGTGATAGVYTSGLSGERRKGGVEEVCGDRSALGHNRIHKQPVAEALLLSVLMARTVKAVRK